MPRTATKKKTCAKCGVDVRKGTEFCYNCGAPVTTSAADPNGKTAELDPKAKAALDDLAEKLKADEPVKTDKLAKAADERKKSRVEKRKPRTFRWEPASESSVMYVLILAVLIAVLAILVVVMTVFIR